MCLGTMLQTGMGRGGNVGNSRWHLGQKFHHKPHESSLRKNGSCLLLVMTKLSQCVHCISVYTWMNIQPALIRRLSLRTTGFLMTVLLPYRRRNSLPPRNMRVTADFSVVALLFWAALHSASFKIAGSDFPATSGWPSGRVSPIGAGSVIFVRCWKSRDGWSNLQWNGF